MTDKKTDTKYDIDYENLAIPEIHTGKAEPSAPEEEKAGISEFQAIPEIHIRRKKKES